MYKYATKILLAFSFLLIGGITASYAQIDSDTNLEVDIPNPFVLRDRAFPAGKYNLKPTDDPNDSAVILELSTLSGRKETVAFDTIAMNNGEAAKNTQLIFDKVGDQYFLSKIWVKGETGGNEIEKGKMEKELIASTGQMPEKVIVNEVKIKSKKIK